MKKHYVSAIFYKKIVNYQQLSEKIRKIFQEKAVIKNKPTRTFWKNPLIFEFSGKCNSHSGIFRKKIIDYSKYLVKQLIISKNIVLRWNVNLKGSFIIGFVGLEYIKQK